MAVNYGIVTKKNPRDADAPVKYHPSLRKKQTLSLKELAYEVSESTSINAADLYAALEVLVNKIPYELSKGNMIELGDLGSFWLRIESEGSDTPEEVNASKITNVMLRLYSGQRVKDALKTLKFTKVSDDTVQEP